LTASPIAVRLAAALKPVKPSSEISIEGISSDEESKAVVSLPNRCHEMRASLTSLEVRTLVKPMLTP
jgi:hypothetical protein